MALSPGLARLNSLTRLSFLNSHLEASPAADRSIGHPAHRESLQCLLPSLQYLPLLQSVELIANGEVVLLPRYLQSKLASARTFLPARMPIPVSC